MQGPVKYLLGSGCSVRSYSSLTTPFCRSWVLFSTSTVLAVVFVFQKMLRRILSRPTLSCLDECIVEIIVCWVNQPRNEEVRKSPGRILDLLKACVRFRDLDVDSFATIIKRTGWIPFAQLQDFILANRWSHSSYSHDSLHQWTLLPHLVIRLTWSTKQSFCHIRSNKIRRNGGRFTTRSST